MSPADLRKKGSAHDLTLAIGILVAELLQVNRNFIYELGLGKPKLTIFVLHKVYVFFEYIPKTLNINESAL